MTCHSRASYIGGAIESVLAQTFTDFELIIVDDRSSDDSMRIAREYAALDSRVRIHINDERLGDYPNRNRAASLATGEYLRYADSDDIQYPHCLEVLVALMDAAPDALFALGGSRAWPGGPVPMLLSPRQAYQREFLGSGMFQIGPGGALLRRAPFLAEGGFVVTSSVLSDYICWLRLCARFPVLLAPADLFWYRTHGGQELQRPAYMYDAAQSGIVVVNALRDAACPLAAEEREQAIQNFAGRR